MWCDIHVVRRWEWKGSSSDHCCGQEVTAGTEGELGTPWGWAACALDTDQPFLWQMSWSETNRQDSGWLHLLDSQKRTPGSWVLLAFCYWFSRALNDISIWHVWTKDGPTYKIKALGPRDPLSASLSVETWAVLYGFGFCGYWARKQIHDLPMWPGWLNSPVGCFSHCL